MSSVVFHDISLTLSALFAAGSRGVTEGCCNVPDQFAKRPAYCSNCTEGVVKARTFGPLTLLGTSVVESIFRPPSNAGIAPVSFPVRYSFDFLASMNRGLTQPHLYVGSVLDFGPIRLAFPTG